MSSIEHHHSDGDDWLTEFDYRWSNGDYATAYGSTPYRHLRLSLDDGSAVNDGSDIETVTIEVVDGLEVARGTGPAEATVLDYNGDVTLRIDDSEVVKTLSNGSVSLDLTTEKPAGSTIEIVAESLADHPAESDRVEIEVVK